MEDDKPEHDHGDSFTDASDICQQLMDRYSKSAAPQHRHLLATAAAMRSLLSAESLPLSPPAYFAAAIAAVEDAASSPQPLDPTAVAALLSFLGIVLPLAPPRGINPAKASEAVEVLVRLLEREKEKEGLAVATVRAGVKCLGVLVGFCDLEDWNSVKSGFETLMKFSVDRRPKVRRCSQECLEKVFRSINCSIVIKEASKLVMSMIKTYMPLAVELSTSGASDGSKEDISSEPKNVEVLHMLNMLKVIVPFLSTKTRSKVLSKVDKVMKSQFSALTRHILKTIETCFETSRVDAIAPVTEKIVVSLSSYVSLGDKNPSDTVISATTLLKCSLDILRAGELSSYTKNLSLVFDSVAGLLTSEASIASHAATILKELIGGHVDQRSLSIDDDRQFEVEGKESAGAGAVKSACAILENSLMTSDGKPNEYILAVISALFLKLGGISVYYLKNILLKLADLMTVGKSKTYHLENCIGSAVIALGPEKILTDVPITLDAGGFTCGNIWLVPILKNNVVGASLGYYMEHIMPLAKSFEKASRKVKRTTIGQNLQDHAHALWGLLPAFCQYPTDLHQNIGSLVDILIKFLKEDSSMHENVAISLQVLVNQNKGALNQKTDAGESNSFEVKESVIEFSNLPTYSKKIATKNIKALALYCTALLQALAGTFIDSAPEKRSFFKDAIGCLASITDSSVTKNILMAFLERFKFIDDKGEFGDPENEKALIDKEEGNSSTLEKDGERCAVMELASSLVGGAKEDLVDLIYSFIKYSFQVTDGIGDPQTYHTLSRILQEHSWFFSSRSVELIDFLLGTKPSTDITTLKSRFSCFHPLMVQLLKIDSEAENAKAFLIVNEIIVTLKDAKEEETRKAAYDVLLDISSSLRDSGSSSFNSESSDAPYQKLITMIMGYLSGASPHIKSGAVSVLSALIYKDASVCVSMPDLIPSLLPLLHGKSLEVIKAVLGFLKVVASCLQTRDLQNLLSSVVKGILPWSAVSRNHFRSKVTVILEIMIRKCGFSAVESVTPERYRSFVKSVVENRHNKTNSKDAADGDAETRQDETSTSRHGNRKRKELDTVPEKTRLGKHRKMREKKHVANKTGTKTSDTSTGAGEGRRNLGARKFNKEKLAKGQPESSRKSNKKNFDKGPRAGQKRKMNMNKKDGAVRKPSSAPTVGKRRKFGKT